MRIGTKMLFRFQSFSDLLKNFLISIVPTRTSLSVFNHTHSVLIDGFLNGLPLGLIIKDARSLKYVKINALGEYYVGKKKSALLGKTDTELWSPEFSKKFSQVDTEIISTGKDVTLPEEVFDTPLGQRWIQTKKVAIKDSRGNVQYILSLIEDITETYNTKKHSEEAKLKVLQQAKMASLGQIAGGIAHEIQNPLSIILGYTNRLEVWSETNSITSERIKKSCQQIAQTCERISHIVLGLKKYSQGIPDEPKKFVPISGLFADTLELCKERFKNHGISLIYPDESSEHNLYCRPTEISQALLSLLNNAFKTVKPLNTKWVKITYESDNDYDIIKIQDSGSMKNLDSPEDLMSSLFTTKPQEQSVGLGLFIANRIIHGHEGQLIIDPDSEHTCFMIFLPKFKDVA